METSAVKLLLGCDNFYIMYSRKYVIYGWMEIVDTMVGYVCRYTFMYIKEDVDVVGGHVRNVFTWVKGNNLIRNETRVWSK